MSAPAEQAEPGFFSRLRARYGWLDHVVRAYTRFNQQNGEFFAAALAYYTIFALFPTLMIGFAGVGFLLARRPDLLNMIDDKIRTTVAGGLGQQLVDLMNSAIDARTSVGLFGMGTAAWAGVGWMSHLRAALSAMWRQPMNGDGYVRGKVSDLLAMLGTFLVIAATVVLTVIGHSAPLRAILKWLELPQLSAYDILFRVVSLSVSLLVSWLLFTWMIARLPRRSVRFVPSLRAGLIAAVGFELFKQLGSLYLRVVLRSPAGATFGPVLGLMLFANVTGLLVLFSAAWAATTAKEDPRDREVAPPAPAVISPRIEVNEGLNARQTVAALAAGAVGALTFSRVFRRDRQP